MLFKRLGIDLGTPVVRLPQAGSLQPRTLEERDYGAGSKLC